MAIRAGFNFSIPSVLLCCLRGTDRYILAHSMNVHSQWVAARQPTPSNVKMTLSIDKALTVTGQQLQSSGNQQLQFPAQVNVLL